jgi:hypothetical protein
VTCEPLGIEQRFLEETTMETSKTLKVIGIVAIVFGAMTVFSGGRALFGGAEARAAVGNAVGFVLWFNFLAGFVYVLTGIGLVKAMRWAANAALGLALATGGVAVAFGLHVLDGGAYEPRTVGALALRLGFWIVVTVISWPLRTKPPAAR